MRYREIPNPANNNVVAFPTPIPEPMVALHDILTDPRPLHQMFEIGDWLTLDGEIGEVVKENGRSLLIRFPSGDKVVARNNPSLEVAPHDKWGKSSLSETFNSVQRYHWEDHSNDDLRLLQAKFQIGDGLFVVQYKMPYYNPGIWEISFTRNGSLELTNTGNASFVLSTVMAATREFIHAVDPRQISFAAKNDEPSRSRLYPRLMRLMQKEFPQYTSSPATAGRTYTTFDVERPKKEYVPPAPKPQPVQHTELSQEDWDDIERMLNDMHR